MDIYEFVGLPYNTFDCFALVKRVFKAFGYDIGDYTEPDYFTRWKIVPLEEIKRFDVIRLSLPNAHTDHVGIYVGDGRFLHVADNSTSRVSRVDLYKHLIKGVYRWRELS